MREPERNPTAGTSSCTGLDPWSAAIACPSAGTKDESHSPFTVTKTSPVAHSTPVTGVSQVTH